MKLETYHFEIKTLIAQFINCFNDIIIQRYNQERNVEDRIHVGFAYAPKTRVLHDIINKAQHIKLPLISVSPTSIVRDQNRVFNKIEGPYHPSLQDNMNYEHVLQPVPVDITINMSIITRFQHDLDQIITNWLPYCDPYIAFSWKQPHTNLEVRNIVEWDGNVSFQDPKDISHTQHYRWLADTSFKLQGWIYKKPRGPVGIIHKVITDFTSVSPIFDDYDLIQQQDTPLTTETFVISARPFLNIVNPFLHFTYLDTRKHTVYGDMLNFTTNVYVSGSPGVFLPAPTGLPVSETSGKYVFWHDPFVNEPKLSAMYPGFSGIEIESWQAKSDTELWFMMPSAVGAGFIDIIIQNDAGLGYLTQDSVRPTMNPYPEALPEHDTYVEYQFPWVNGVKVIDY